MKSRSPQPRVLVTRAPHQASLLAEALAKRGLATVLVPTIEMAPPHDFERLDEGIRQLLNPAPGRAFDWIAFTSANAYYGLRDRLQGVENSADVPSLLRSTGVRVGSIGPATSRVLGQEGVVVDLTAKIPTAVYLARGLLPYVHRPDGSPARFFVPQSESGRDDIAGILGEAGGDVFVAPAYSMIGPEGTPAALQKLFGPGGDPPEAVTFTSSSSATNLAAMLQAAGVRLPETVLRASIGPTTTQTLTELGIPPHVQAETATVESLADAVYMKLSINKR